ncbi:MAG: hypothetical protein Q7T55_24325, partial [Solirubrobacteraceae bacterium]|nr:hypothetical protein [Solirubrobacteraceae bacterium]
GFVLMLLLHFSIVVSSLTDENVILAQRVGLLQQEIDGIKGEQPVDEKIAEQVREFGPSQDPPGPAGP